MDFNRLTALFLIFSCNCFGLASCEPNEQGNPTVVNKEAENNITLAFLGIADSASEQNKGYGLAYFIYADLIKDSVYLFRRRIMTDSTVWFERSSKTIMVKNLKLNSHIQSVLRSQEINETGTNRANINLQENGLDFGQGMLNYPIFYLRIKTASIDKSYSYGKEGLSPEFSNITNFLLGLTTNNSMSLSSRNLNEDSIVVSIVERPELSTIPSALPLPIPIPTPPITYCY